MTFHMPDLSRESALTFSNQLRAVRLDALRDAEGFGGIVHAVERIGSYLAKEQLGDLGKPGNLGKYEQAISEFVANSGLEPTDPDKQSRAILMPFQALYHSVRIARNDAVHQGAFARHLTEHAIQLAIILEDSLKPFLDPIASDFMVRNPDCAELWHPLAFLRQQMLANSYTYLPVWNSGRWQLVSDSALARFLGPEREGVNRRKLLAMRLADATASSLQLENAKLADETTTIEEALKYLNDAPVLLIPSPTHSDRLVGLMTAFDLL
jgi:hypothetical protein